MEIEAKFIVPDEDTFQGLLETIKLAGFSLGERHDHNVHDRYVDTRDGAFRAQGLACRLRKEDDRFLATLKGRGTRSGAVHRRIEHEVELPGLLPPREWPASKARALALAVGGSEPHTLLFEVEQARQSRVVYDEDRQVAECSLDQVCLCRAGTCAKTLLELEVELLADGTQHDLDRIVSELRDVWYLAPERFSKFERGLVLFKLDSLPGPRLAPDENGVLTATERVAVEHLSQEREAIARRARALLAWDDGLSRDEIAEISGLSPRRVRHWLSAFRQQRLHVFPDWALRMLPGVVAGTLADEQALAEPIKDPREAAAVLALKAFRTGWRHPSRSIVLPEEPGIEADDPMSEAGRKILLFHFLRMLYNEPGTRLGEDIEALHDMRVASRRLRAAFRVFGGHYEPDVVDRYVRGMKRTRRALGPVRDLDVFRVKTESYRASLPEGQRGGLSGFLELLEARREGARERMLAYLDSIKHRRFVEGFGEFSVTDGMGSLPVTLSGDGPRPYRVRHVAPVAIHERLAAVRAFDEWVSIPLPPLSRLHALRIACKGLRYSLEFFREILGPATNTLIERVVAVQDHLGDLQDAAVASQILRDYVLQETRTHTVGGGQGPGLEAPVRVPGVEAYLEAKQSELRHLVDTFPEVWEDLRSCEFSQMVADALGVL